MTAPYRTPTTGELLANRYELGAHIDAGGMAEVWEAKDHTLGRTVAVKILHAHLARDAAFLRRFRREAINAARLQHPTIVAIYDAVSFDGLEAIVMERIEGRTLRSVLDEHARLPARDVIDMGRQIAQALHVAHDAGVVHRDIKPSNIMLCEDRRIRVTDFGIAKAGEDTDLTRTGTLLGTAKYLSPEQVLGDEVDARSDLYGLGVVLFEALAGRPPFDEGNDYATAQARVIANAPLLSQFRPDLPPTLDDLIDRLLSQDPNDRPGSAEELAVALSSIRVDSEEFANLSSPVDFTTIDLRSPVTPTTAETRVSDARSSDSLALNSTDDFVPIPPPTGDDVGTDYPEDRPESGGLLRGISVGMLLMLGVVLTGLVVSGLLLSRGLENEPGTSAQPNPTVVDLSEDDSVSLTPTQEFGPPTVALVQAVDPLGDQTEMDELAGNAIDGDQDTAWTTEDYSTPGFADVKTGVGFLVTFESPSVISRLVIASPTDGWTAQVFVGDERGEGPEGWSSGPFAIAGPSDTEGVVETELELVDSTTGAYLLLWLTFEGQTPADDSDDPKIENRFVLAEITIE